MATYEYRVDKETTIENNTFYKVFRRDVDENKTTITTFFAYDYDQVLVAVPLACVDGKTLQPVVLPDEETFAIYRELVLFGRDDLW